MFVFVKPVPSVIDFKNGQPVLANTYKLTYKLLTEKRANLIKDKILAKGSVDLKNREKVNR